MSNDLEKAISAFVDSLENIDFPDWVERSFASQFSFLQSIKASWEGLRKVVPASIEVEKETGMALETEVDDSEEFIEEFDQRHLIEGRVVKWYNPKTHIGDITGTSRRTLKRRLTFHHTAVKGGFGPWRNVVERYMKHDPQYDPKIWRADRKLDHVSWATAMALAHRYRGDPPVEYNYGVPYHAILAQNSILYFNLPCDGVSWHGHGANTYGLGVVWDAHSLKEAPKNVNCLIQMVESLVDEARDEGHPIKEFDVHAMWTNKPSDPGARFIEEVMIPAAKLTQCTVVMDEKVNKSGALTIREILDAG